MPRWFELSGKHIPSAASFAVLCPIVAPPFWKGLPGALLRSRRYGWISESNAVTVLDPFALKSYRIFEDPEDYQVLFEKEADAEEQQLVRDFGVLTQERAFGAAREVHEKAHRLFLERVLKLVIVPNLGAFRVPNPREHAISVQLQKPRRLENLQDRGTIVLRSGGLPLDQIRPTVEEILTRGRP